MTIQGQLNQSYFDLINLEELLQKVSGDFERNQIKCEALRLADTYSKSIADMTDIEKKSVLADLELYAQEKDFLKN
jgi:hypothetical protein